MLSILLLQNIATIGSIDTFFMFFYVSLRFRRMDNLFFVEKNLIKVSCVLWKDILLFFGSSVFPKSNFSENFLKSLVQISIQFYLSIAQILVLVYLKFLENFLIFVRCPHISFNISSLLNIPVCKMKQHCDGCTYVGRYYSTASLQWRYLKIQQPIRAKCTWV